MTIGFGAVGCLGSSPFPFVDHAKRRGGMSFSCGGFIQARARARTKAGENIQQTMSLQAIQKSGVIACLRAQSGELALEVGRMALDVGISVVIAELVEEYPSAVIGAGTVLTCDDAKNAKSAGAKFLMSPSMVEEILEAFKCGPILYIPGAMTPTEVLNAHASGARIVKIYPISLLGGDQYMRALRNPFHHIPMVASHGITMEVRLFIEAKEVEAGCCRRARISTITATYSLESYISMGASAVVLSDAIFNKTAMSIRDFDVISQLASVAASKGAAAVENFHKFP